MQVFYLQHFSLKSFPVPYSTGPAIEFWTDANCKERCRLELTEKSDFGHLPFLLSQVEQGPGQRNDASTSSSHPSVEVFHDIMKSLKSQMLKTLNEGLSFFSDDVLLLDYKNNGVKFDDENEADNKTETPAVVEDVLSLKYNDEPNDEEVLADDPKDDSSVHEVVGASGDEAKDDDLASDLAGLNSDTPSVQPSTVSSELPKLPVVESQTIIVVGETEIVPPHSEEVVVVDPAAIVCGDFVGDEAKNDKFEVDPACLNSDTGFVQPATVSSELPKFPVVETLTNPVVGETEIVAPSSENIVDPAALVGGDVDPTLSKLCVEEDGIFDDPVFGEDLQRVTNYSVKPNFYYSILPSLTPSTFHFQSQGDSPSTPKNSTLSHAPISPFVQSPEPVLVDNLPVADGKAKRQTKLSKFLSSPYNNRQIDIEPRVTEVELMAACSIFVKRGDIM